VTPNKKRVLDIVKVYQDVYSYSPTYAEIAKEYGCTKQNVSKMVKSLEIDGYLQIDRGKHRGIRLLDN
jgi:DNA-binding MarR family transcriptional regulator